MLLLLLLLPGLQQLLVEVVEEEVVRVTVQHSVAQPLAPLAPAAEEEEEEVLRLPLRLEQVPRLLQQLCC
jgi:hypothetical protein